MWIPPLICSYDPFLINSGYLSFYIAATWISHLVSGGIEFVAKKTNKSFH